jgi:hypothetical protein
VLLILLGSKAHASSITILSQQYRADGGISWEYGFDYDSQSASTPVHIDLGYGTLIGDADGFAGPSSGFLSVVAHLIGAGGGVSSDAMINFLAPAGPSVLNLNTSGMWVGFALSYVQLKNLTDNTVLLNFAGNYSACCFADLTGSFAFTLEPLKEYRLWAHADTPPDAGWARVDYAVVPVSEPSSAVLLAVALACPILFFTKRRKNRWAHRHDERGGTVSASRPPRGHRTIDPYALKIR